MCMSAAKSVPEPFLPWIHTLTRWFEAAKKVPNTEIEGKIGKYNENSHQFESIVPVSLFNLHLSRCQKSSVHGNIFDAREKEMTITYLFSDGVRGTEYSDHRNEFCRKRRISSYDFTFIDPSFIDNSSNHVTFRVCHNVEDPCEPSGANVDWVRIRNRESFFYKKTWRFDFTQVQEGSTRLAAQSSPVHHEIEVEYIGDNDEYSAEYNVISLLLKLHDLSFSVPKKPDFMKLIRHGTGKH